MGSLGTSPVQIFFRAAALETAAMGVKKAAGKGTESSAVTCGKDPRIQDSGCSLIPPFFQNILCCM